MINLQAYISATLLKRDFNTVVFLWNLQISKNTCFTEEFQWLLLTFNSYFQRSSEQKPVWLWAKTPHSAKKNICCRKKSRSSHRRCSLKEGLQRPAEVFSCEYCETFKNTYFEKHLWTTASENQIFSDKFTEGR